MGRKKLYNDEMAKITADVSNGVKIRLDNLAAMFKKGLGPVINLILENLVFMDADLRSILTDACKEHYIYLDMQLQGAGEYVQIDLREQKKRCATIAQIFNPHRELDFESYCKKKIELEIGHVLVPKDWIVLNPEDAQHCMYAGVVECRHHKEFGIPHFLFFTNKQYSCDYDKELEESVLDMCLNKWPMFQTVLEKQVKPIRDPENPGRFLNAEECVNSPAIGLFHIDEKGEGLDCPSGAMIIRK